MSLASTLRIPVWLLLASAGGACSNIRLGQPPIRALYHQDAQRLARNPVIVIHGILGSRLVEQNTGKVVWGAFTDESIDVNTVAGARAFALDLETAAGGDVIATGPVDKIDMDLFFGIVSVDVYAQILKALGVGGYSDSLSSGPGYASDHYTCHSFFYDWRLDNVHNAKALGEFIRKTRVSIDRNARAKLLRLRAQASPESLADALELEAWLAEGYRFDIVAHSMGGLIARYFLRYGSEDLPQDGGEPIVTWAGSEEVDRLVLVGTPSLGSMQAFQELLHGMDLGFLLPSFDRALLGSMPSVYQLMPRNLDGMFYGEHGEPFALDVFDVEMWGANGWGLLDPRSAELLLQLLPELESAEARKQKAKDYLAWCLGRAQAFQHALDKDPALPSPTELRLFASDTIPTLSRACVTGQPGELVLSFAGPGTQEPGDGTVARYSALGDRQYGNQSYRGWMDTSVEWSSVTFLPDDHVGLTSNPQFTDNLLFYLLSQEPKRSLQKPTN